MYELSNLNGKGACCSVNENRKKYEFPSKADQEKNDHPSSSSKI